jgi:hypothetical protein
MWLKHGFFNFFKEDYYVQEIDLSIFFCSGA